MRWMVTVLGALVMTDESAFGEVVVELFTSEGCSSCPPADELLRELAKEEGVVVLAWHVDYWDQLGWKDPFGQKEATPRQRGYGRALGLDTIYTPQMVVDGRAEFVGSDRYKAQREIERAREGKKVSVAVSGVFEARQKELTITLLAENAPKDGKVFVAVTEDNLASDVKRGENSGRKLEHDAVVRRFEEISLKDGRGKVVVKADKGWKLGDLKVVGWIQERELGEIVGAGAGAVAVYVMTP